MNEPDPPAFLTEVIERALKHFTAEMEAKLGGPLTYNERWDLTFTPPGQDQQHLIVTVTVEQAQPLARRSD